ncbi:B3 domain-containing protein REM16-like isoform X2 [Amaranthus tricolor]|uniref:B3 domain-containing protein REM16-like isoform X2 n=1 Tax=Amaranthus tricolor TaxID=29722 RepID=UPI00258510E2|nr:B3 domain-containing protein REM16-like isoform X2 [Amaranthus tricolor]
MVKSDCEHCKTWEEDMYWKHFNTLHFFVTLSPNFQDHLVLPEKFAAHMKAHLPDRVSVKGPSGALWQIQLLKSGDLLFVGNEWKDFVKAYDLKENCLLMFKYERNSRFEVLIFDNGSFCEKEATYFVKQGSGTMSEQEDKKRRTEGEVVSTEIMEDDNEEDSTPVVSKKPRKHSELMACSREKLDTQINVLYATARDIQPCGEVRHIPEWNLVSVVQDESTPDVDRPPKLEAHSGEHRCADFLRAPDVDRPPKLEAHSEIEPFRIDSFKEVITPKTFEYSPVTDCFPRVDGQTSKLMSFGTSVAYHRQHSPKEIHPCQSRGKCGRRKKFLSGSASNEISLPKEYKSTRRVVTEKEKEDALQSALQEQTDASFTVVLPPSTVYRRFFLTVPAAWQSKRRLRNLQEVILRVGEKTWHTTFLCYGKKGGLSAGWKTFALDNFLEEFDVLVFKPVSRSDEVVMMDVAIFRVVSTISSLIPIAYY